MTILVTSFPSLVIHIPVGAMPIQVKAHLEQRLASRPLYPRVGGIAGARISPFHMMDHRGGNIVAVIRNMGIKMMPIPIIMRNHFPTVIAAMIGKVGMPFATRSAPFCIPGIRVILLKTLLNRTRNVLVVTPVLSQHLLAPRQ